ncbi:beta-lactamase family protein [Sphingosinicellaceae bacterium]|nr:beta-lactamase family protein [Sphingosinicellaceae bacterium]
MTSTTVTVHGVCDRRFAAVREEFERNFETRGEVGAAVAISLRGEPVVDLWAGTADRDSGRPWQKQTSVVVFSATKGMAATCLHMLADRGELDFDAPVASYWPEFAANGKAGVTVAMVMSHQAGLPVWHEPLPERAMLDWELVTGRLAEQAPQWEPGTTHGYHAMSLGFLEGEIFRRIAGRTIGSFLADEVAGPLGAEVWIGLPEAEEINVATTYLAETNPTSPIFSKLMAEPEWFGWKLITNTGGDGAAAMVNSRERHAAEIPAAGGIATARGLARLYAPLSADGSMDGIRLVAADAVPLMSKIRAASDIDTVLRVPTTFTLGFSKCWGDRRLGQGEHVILGEHAFGTPGLGGSIGFADPEAGMSFGYVMNQHGSGVGLNDRGQSLIDAAYRSIGYSSSASGPWTR